MLLPLASSYAEDAKIFTDDDLLGYGNQSGVDDETLKQKEEALKAWERSSEEERTKTKKDQEEKKTASPQKQNPKIIAGGVYSVPPTAGIRRS